MLMNTLLTALVAVWIFLFFLSPFTMLGVHIVMGLAVYFLCDFEGQEQ